jgi:hypothetical protein
VAQAPTPSTAVAGQDDTPVGDLPSPVQAAFDALDRSAGPWCLLRGAADLAASSGDVDVLVHPRALASARRTLAEAGFVELPSPGRGSHRFFFAYDPVGGRWTKFDVVTELAFGRHQELPIDAAEGCLERRLAAARPPRLDSDDAFWTYLLHALLDRRRLRPIDIAQLRELAADAGADSPMATTLSPLLPGGWTPARVIEAARRGEATVLATVGRAVRRRWVRRAPLRVGSRLVIGWASRRAGMPLAALQQGGLSVALLGPDGAGKSTIAEYLEEGAFPVPVRRVYLGLYGRGADGGDRGPSGRFGLAGRLAWLERRSLGARCQQARGRLVVYDRHVLDVTVGGSGAGPKARLRRWLLAHAVPRPDLTIVLDVPGDELFRRKGEHDPATLERRREGYLELAGRMRGAAVIDASADPEIVRRAVVDRIWAAYCGRATAGAPSRPPSIEPGSPVGSGRRG